MSGSERDVVVVGGGAAGVAAARTLRDAGVDAIIVEARPRLGGRAFTVLESGFPLDLGCGWLHSADQNPWCAIAEGKGLTIDRTPPPWSRRGLLVGFPASDQRAFGEALEAFRDQLAAFDGPGDPPTAHFLPPGGRWNELINAVSTFYSGAELDRISTLDYARYDDTGVNWRLVKGYGYLIAGYGAGLPARLGCRVRRIDHSGKAIRIETDQGTVVGKQLIVTLPTNILARDDAPFYPTLPAKREAAAGLPLGLADKLFLSLEGAEEFDAETRLFGRTDTHRTATYHFRPFGRPIIEAYFGGELAAELETASDAAFFEFARGQLTDLLGGSFARRIAPIALHRWGSDPFARGSYSYALPGKADERARLAEPVDGRIFFAGEACSRTDFSTAHGAYATGLAVAKAIIAART